MVQSEDHKQRAEAARRVIELNARHKDLSAEVSSIKNAANNGTGPPLGGHRTFAQISRQLEAVNIEAPQRRPVRFEIPQVKSLPLATANRRIEAERSIG